MSRAQLRADLFELQQLARRRDQLDASRISAHVAAIRKDALALLADPELEELANEVVGACDALELPSVAELPPPQAAPPTAPALKIAVERGEERWLWRFPGDAARLRAEWLAGGVPKQLLDDTDAFRGVLGLVERVSTYGAIHAAATSDGRVCVLTIDGEELRWRPGIDIGLRRDGEHLATWRFPYGAAKLIEQFTDGCAPLSDMPAPKTWKRPYLGQVLPPTGEETAWIELLPGWETHLVLDGTTHPLRAMLDQATLPMFDRLPGFGAGDRPRSDARGTDRHGRVVRLAVFSLTAADLAGRDLQHVEELVLGPTVLPEVLEAVLARVRAEHLAALTLEVPSPELVARATGLTTLTVRRARLPALPPALRVLRVEGPPEVAELAAALDAHPTLQLLELKEHGLDLDQLERLTGPWLVDAGRGWKGLDDELYKIDRQVEFEDLERVALGWMGRLRTALTTVAEIEGVKLGWGPPRTISGGARSGARALRSAAVPRGLTAWFGRCADVLERLAAGFAGDYGNDLGLERLSGALVASAALARDRRPGGRLPVRPDDAEERARQAEEIRAVLAR